MATKKKYLPTKETERVTWLFNFNNKLPGYAVLFGLTPTEITQIADDTSMYGYIILQTEARKTDTKNITEYKSKLSFAPIGTPIGPVPVPEIIAAPTAVPAGIFTRLSGLIKQIKGKATYTTDIGDDLGIIGEDTIFDPTTLKPVLKIKLNTGGHPVIKCRKNKTDRFNLYVDRRNGSGMKFLATISKTQYIDMYPLPNGGGGAPVPPGPGVPGPAPAPVGQIAAVWDYKAAYVIDDEEVGEYSDLTSITVGPAVV